MAVQHCALNKTTVAALLTNRARAASMAERAKQDALSRFSVERHVEQICAIYDEVLHA
jgi:hypothetical protein